jgi:hypothetical protein
MCAVGVAIFAARNRWTRLGNACRAAIERVEAKEAAGIDPDTFQELGEALFWLVALAEEHGRKVDAPLLRGLRWARNEIAHGFVVDAPVGWHYGAELGRLVLDKAQLDTTSGHEWLPRAQVPVDPTQVKRHEKDGQAYDEAVAGRRVVETLREGYQLAL